MDKKLCDLRLVILFLKHNINILVNNISRTRKHNVKFNYCTKQQNTQYKLVVTKQYTCTSHKFSLAVSIKFAMWESVSVVISIFLWNSVTYSRWHN